MLGLPKHSSVLSYDWGPAESVQTYQICGAIQFNRRYKAKIDSLFV